MQPTKTLSPSKDQIWKMFDQISSTYDTVNRAMTGGMDVIWRKKVSSCLPRKNEIELLDLATGTGDQIFSLCKHFPSIRYATGIDMSKMMLEIAKQKLELTPFKDKISFIQASALDIPFADESFDCVTMSFGIRNVTCPMQCLQEIYRVLKPGGRVIILESSLPHNLLIKKLHLFYLRNILPRIGGILSKKKEAYVYLNQTIESFPSGKHFCNLLEISRFTKTQTHPLMLGAVSIYQADKPLY
jgi:demethylmenaquinone methyltransferase/2-methoxy-6-polyprenyl-1,4-benzoquinol methylase